jgi:hypothetical protein
VQPDTAIGAKVLRDHGPGLGLPSIRRPPTASERLEELTAGTVDLWEPSTATPALLPPTCRKSIRLRRLPSLKVQGSSRAQM